MLDQIIEKAIMEKLNPQRVVNNDSLIGKKCMFRTYSAGVHFGELVGRQGKECLLKDSRRVFSWAEACSLSQLAMEGSKDLSGCKIAMTVPQILLTEVIEIIPMSLDAYEQLMRCTVWKK